jgi:hypothetical protein
MMNAQTYWNQNPKPVMPKYGLNWKVLITMVVVATTAITFSLCVNGTLGAIIWFGFWILVKYNSKLRKLLDARYNII